MKTTMKTTHVKKRDAKLKRLFRICRRLGQVQRANRTPSANRSLTQRQRMYMRMGGHTTAVFR